MIIKDLHRYIERKRSALHVGGCIGEERYWYDAVNFDRVIWFEPNVELFPQLKENILIYGNQVAVNLGIHDTLKEAVLHVASNRGQSSSILEFDKHLRYHPKVRYVGDQTIKLVRMDDWFKTNSFDIKDFNFLNVDVQGVELNVIKSFGDLIGQLDYIYTEVNVEHLYKNCCLVGEIDTYLLKYGFKRSVTKMTPYKWGDALYVKI